MFLGIEHCQLGAMDQVGFPVTVGIKDSQSHAHPNVQRVILQGKRLVQRREDVVCLRHEQILISCGQDDMEVVGA